jgi:hypothetical protein
VTEQDLDSLAGLKLDAGPQLAFGVGAPAHVVECTAPRCLYVNTENNTLWTATEGWEPLSVPALDIVSDGRDFGLMLLVVVIAWLYLRIVCVERGYRDD